MVTENKKFKQMTMGTIKQQQTKAKQVIIKEKKGRVLEGMSNWKAFGQFSQIGLLSEDVKKKREN